MGGRMALNESQWCLVKGLGWTTLTTIASLLGLIAHSVYAMASKEISLEFLDLVKNGSLILFSATLAAAVLVDILFDQTVYSARSKRSIKLIVCSAVGSIIFSMMCYPIVLTVDPKNLEPDALQVLTLGALLTTLTTAVSAKTITLAGGDHK
jgi:hypothetical protein